MKDYLHKANVLLEVLPYIKQFHNCIVVIKIGGEPMITDELKEFIAQDIVLMKYVGIKPVIVHGGGKQITDLMHKLGKKSVFIDGLRVTDKETMDITEMVLTGMINKDLVGLINHHGGKAVGISGRDAHLIEASKIKVKKTDYGFVGEIKKINPTIIHSLIEQGFIPVISPVGMGEDGDAYNINADIASGEIASAIKALKLIMLTDVRGIYKGKGDKKKFLSTITKKEIASFIKQKIIQGGMLPKVKACLSALQSGVSKTHIIDGKIPHSLLLEIFTEAGVGTEIINK
ncbi:MAG: acetylglutamate kinase [Spirochaetes bacterium]|nr:acetylglutamate kinase [Spirochaetota bacterium]